MKFQLKFFILIVLLVVPFGVTSVNARTKQKAIQDFLVSLDTGFGFKETPSSQIARVSSTTHVLMTAPFIEFEVKDKSKLFHFYQAHQNNDSGFGDVEGDASDLEASLLALLGLQYLGYNYSALVRWEALNYVNKTLVESLTTLVFDSRVNRTIPVYLDNYEPRVFEVLSLFFVVSAGFDYQWTGNLTHLINIALNYQFKNGSYVSVEHACASLTFLSLVGVKPMDRDGAIDYLLAFQSTKGGFSSDVNKTGNLETTWRVIKTLTIMKVDLEKRLDYLEETIKFILDLQSSSGGFDGGEGVSAEATYYAVETLAYLNAMDELLQKEFLQAVGFLDVSLKLVMAVMGILFVIRKRLLQRGV